MMCRSFLTLTGNDQPFQVLTSEGRFLAIVSYVIAIAVVPGQLARVVGSLGMKQMQEMEDRMGKDKVAHTTI
eukprot:1189726-Prorocentrum_minimum.AAC.7